MIENCTINIWFKTQSEEEILKNISIFLEANNNVISQITELSEGKILNNSMLQNDIKEIRTLVLCTLWYLYDFTSQQDELVNLISKIEDIRLKIKIILKEE